MQSTIIVGIDGSERSRDAVALARTLARYLDAGITMVCAYPYQRMPFQLNMPEYEADLRSDAHEHLDRAAELIAGVSAIEKRAIGCLSPARALQSAAEEVDAAMIVVASSHRGSIGRVLPGTVGERLLQGAPCPVAVAPVGHWGHGDPRLRKIGVAFDDSPEAALALEAALELAQHADGTVELIRVLDPEHGRRSHLGGGIGYHETVARHERAEVDREAAQKHLHGVLAQLPPIVTMSRRVIEAEPAQGLISASEDLDLLICGSRGYGPLHSVLVGGLSGQLIRSAACPVIVTPRGAPSRQSGAAASGSMTAASR